MAPKSFVLGDHVLQPCVFWRQSSIIYANEAEAQPGREGCPLQQSHGGRGGGLCLSSNAAFHS